MATKKIELKNIKHAAFSSEETECFSATVYIDGVKRGVVSNDGHGGCNTFHPWEMQSEIDDYAATLPKHICSWIDEKTGKPQEMELDAELLIGDLLSDYLRNKDLKRRCSKKVYFRKPSEQYAEGEYSTLNCKYSSGAKYLLVKKYGADVFILNEALS